jgi:methionyl-tRNA formyltransferase
VRVAFLGNDRWSVPTLQALAAASDVEVVLVVTNPPRPAGRGSRLRPTDVAEAAGELGLQVLEVDGVREGAGPDAIEAAEPEALVVVAYGGLLPAEVLDVPPLGTVNLHFSLLPRWRGAAPVQRAIIEGDDVTGVSVMLLDEGLDTGPVLDRVEVPIASDEDAGTLGGRLAELGAPVVVEALRSLADGSADPRPQGHAGATYAAKVSPEERELDWSHPAGAIVRRVRALAPSPGATTLFRRGPMKVLRAEVRRYGYTLEALPSVARVRIDRDGVPTVATSDGEVALLEVAPAGRARMSGADWARGARFGAEERLG